MVFAQHDCEIHISFSGLRVVPVLTSDYSSTYISGITQARDSNISSRSRNVAPLEHIRFVVVLGR